MFISSCEVKDQTNIYKSPKVKYELIENTIKIDKNNSISNINNFRPAYDQTIQEYASTTATDTETSSDIVDIKPQQPNPTQIPEPPRFP